ncbi:hypothetical protein BGW41_007680 [Actinomortierella wolfii]|nr:hypothetical protein BGW41_007680 [Actinomortierella wolfii]
MRALAAMESSVEQITAADFKVTELLRKEFGGKPSLFNSRISTMSDVLSSNEEGRIAKNDLLDAANALAHGNLSTDGKDLCPTAPASKSSQQVKNK